MGLSKHTHLSEFGASGNYWVVINGIRANLVIPCGLGHMGPNEDVRDLSGGDCDAPNSDKCVFTKNKMR